MYHFKLPSFIPISKNGNSSKNLLIILLSIIE